MARVGVDVKELARELLALSARVPDTAVRFKRARIDAHVEQVGVLVGDNFENQTAERLLRIGLAFLLLVFQLRMLANYRGSIERIGQIPANRVHERLNADVLAAGTAQHGLNMSGDRLLAENF